MKPQEIKTNTIIRAKGIDISIGNEIDKVALFSQNTGNAVTFKSICIIVLMKK